VVGLDLYWPPATVCELAARRGPAASKARKSKLEAPSGTALRSAAFVRPSTAVALLA
jgi:hypothetical protein